MNDATFALSFDENGKTNNSEELIMHGEYSYGDDEYVKQNERQIFLTRPPRAL